MCAIFGWFNPDFASNVDTERLLRHLARKSQMYGEKSFGLAARKPAAGGRTELEVVRYTGSASSWLEQNSKELKKLGSSNVLIGHTRMPTHGAVTKLNAHPFPIGDWIVGHNGVIRNSSELMGKALFVAKGETDSEEALCYVVGKSFSAEALKEIRGSFAFEAISRDGRQGLLICDSNQNLFVAKVGAGFVWCTDGDALKTSLVAAGAGDLECVRMRSQILNLATGAMTALEESGTTLYTPSYTGSAISRYSDHEDDLEDLEEATRRPVGSPIAGSIQEQLDRLNLGSKRRIKKEKVRPPIWPDSKLTPLNGDAPPELQ